MNSHLFLWHCPFKALCINFKKWLGSWMTSRSMIQRGDFTKNSITGNSAISYHNLKYFYPRSVAQAGSNAEKTVGKKIFWNVPLNRIWKSNMTPQYDTVGRLIDSAQYDTAGRLTLRNMIPCGDWLCAVWYPKKFEYVGEILTKIEYILENLVRLSP